MWWLLLVGCDPEPPVESEYAFVASVGTLPERAGDPIQLRSVELQRWVDGEPLDDLCGVNGVIDSPFGCEPERRAPEPVVRDAAGERVAVQPVLGPQGRIVDWTVPRGVGVFQISGIVGAPGVSLREEIAFELLDWGLADDLVLAGLEGSLWELGAYSAMPLDINDAAPDLHPPMWVELTDVDEEGADLRVVASGEAGDCVALTARAEWRGSELVWETDTMTLEHPELGDLSSEDLSISIAWRTGEPDIADARVAARVDIAPLSPLLTNAEEPEPDVGCTLLATFGLTCEPCDTLESADCLQLRGYAGELTRVEDTLPVELPTCGVDLDGVPNFACDIEMPECSCASGAGPAAWTLALPLLVVLRRRAPAARRQRSDAHAVSAST